jgi:hypothetical protein
MKKSICNLVAFTYINQHGVQVFNSNLDFLPLKQVCYKIYRIFQPKGKKQPCFWAKNRILKDLYTALAANKCKEKMLSLAQR